MGVEYIDQKISVEHHYGIPDLTDSLKNRYKYHERI